MEKESKVQMVAIVDVQMPFWSMVVFLVKLTLASIPAALLIFIITISVLSLKGPAFFILQLIKNYPLSSVVFLMGGAWAIAVTMGSDKNKASSLLPVTIWIVLWVSSIGYENGYRLYWPF